jgi:hypothetical protein
VLNQSTQLSAAPFDGLPRASRPRGENDFGLEEPMIVSASAWSFGSPRLPRTVQCWRPRALRVANGEVLRSPIAVVHQSPVSSLSRA